MKKTVRNIAGHKFGKLTVLSFCHAGNRSAWLCLCECGKERVVRHNNLMSGNTTSCGCSRKITCIPPRRKPSGFMKYPEYGVWRAMKQRCNNPNNPFYKNYGGRGIIICKEWNESFGSFILAVGRRPTKSHQLDRINNNGNYEPSNCRWATPSQNGRNRRGNNRIALKGEAHTISEWAQMTGINSGTIWSRIYKSKWSIADALSTPVLQQMRNRFAK